MTATAAAADPVVVTERRNLPTLTGLRAVAAGAVFAHHLWDLPGPARDVWNVLAEPGAAGVTFFFILSGFVLAWSMRPSDTPKAFYRRRFARIYPSLFVALVIALIVVPTYNASAHPSVLQAASAFLGLQSWIPYPDWYFAVLGVTWTLSCEAFFYLTFPLYAKRIWELSAATRRQLQLALAGTVIAFGVASSIVDDDVVSALVTHLPLIRVADFALGALIAVDVAKGTFPKVRLGHALILAAVFYLLAGAFPNTLRDIGVPLVPLAILIGAGAQADLSGARTFFANRRVVWLGVISYCFYLIHTMVIGTVSTSMPKSIGTILVLPAAIAAAAALHYLVERPAEARLRGDRTVRADSDAAPAPAVAE